MPWVELLEAPAEVLDIRILKQPLAGEWMRDRMRQGLQGTTKYDREDDRQSPPYAEVPGPLLTRTI